MSFLHILVAVCGILVLGLFFTALTVEVDNSFVTFPLPWFFGCRDVCVHVFDREAKTAKRKETAEGFHDGFSLLHIGVFCFGDMREFYACRDYR